jgi:beta-lactam-binding protein with PASTA domain
VGIFLAALALLGFSVYLAAQLHFISLPFLNGVITPSTSIVYDIVPDLKGLSWQEAQQTATRAGFNLQSNNGTSGVVVSQSYTPGSEVPKGKTILVTMGANTQKIPAIPPGPGANLASYEALLQSLGFNKFTPKSDGTDPNLPPNTVSNVSPSPGSSVAVDTQVIIYVKNLNATPTVTPSLSPTAKASPSPTVKPSPSPTVKPSPTITPSPSPSSDPTPDPTP